MPKKSDPSLPDRLLTRALVMLAEQGGPSFSMRALAREEGYAVTAVYRCFPSRAALLKAMQVRLFEQLPHTLEVDTLACQPLPQALETMAVRFVTWAVDNPAHYRFMFLCDEADALLDPGEQAVARAPLILLRSLLAAVELREGLDPSATATWLFAGLHGLVSLHLQARLDVDEVPDLVAFVRTHCRAWLATFILEATHDA